MASARTSARLEALLAKGDCAGALAYLKGLGPASPTTAAAAAAVLTTALKLKQTGPAREAFALTSLDGLDPAGLRQLSVDLADGGLGEESLKLLERLGPEERNRFGVLEREARLHTSQGRPEEAEAVFRKITELYPTTPKGWLMRARFYKTARDADQEAACLMQALTFSLKSLPILKRLAVLKGGGGQHRESLDLWRQVLRIAPGDQEASVGVLRQLHRMKRFDQALAWAEAHREHLSGEAEADKLMGLLAEHQAAAAA